MIDWIIVGVLILIIILLSVKLYIMDIVADRLVEEIFRLNTLGMLAVGEEMMKDFDGLEEAKASVKKMQEDLNA